MRRPVPFRLFPREVRGVCGGAAVFLGRIRKICGGILIILSIIVCQTH